MKTRPIIFSGPMIRAILEGKKTQTRRVMKPQPYQDAVDTWHWRACEGVLFGWLPGVLHPEMLSFCPYGAPGDRLWVRETWAAHPFFNSIKPSLLAHDEPIRHRATYQNESHFMWRPSIFMPRWASRITLEVTGVKAERVQDISRKDAIAEGVNWKDCKQYQTLKQVEAMIATVGYTQTTIDYIDGFRKLWDSINAKPKPVKRKGAIVHYVSYPWDEASRDPRTEIRGKPHHCYPNSWVWVIEFRGLK